jgi:hypothetical protein
VVRVTGRPGGSHLDVDLLRELQDELALIASSRRAALERRERADVLDRAATAREAGLEERLADALSRAASEVVQVPPSHRPRLETSPNEGDRRRAANALLLVQSRPKLSNRAIARLAGVHRDVVKRLRCELADTVAEKMAEKSA